MRNVFLAAILFFELFLMGTMTECVYAAEDVQPPHQFVLRGRMPGEGMPNIGMNYIALDDVILYSQPTLKASQVGHINKGEKARMVDEYLLTEPLQGTVYMLERHTFGYSVPLPDNCTEFHYTYGNHRNPVIVPAGAKIYLITYTGEGTYMAWYNNRLIEWIEPQHIKLFGKRWKYPVWGVYTGDKEKPVYEYWLKLKKEDGTTGWAQLNYKKLHVDLYS